VVRFETPIRGEDLENSLNLWLCLVGVRPAVVKKSFHCVTVLLSMISITLSSRLEVDSNGLVEKSSSPEQRSFNRTYSSLSGCSQLNLSIITDIVTRGLPIIHWQSE
jgi:hypothetical protein